MNSANSRLVAQTDQDYQSGHLICRNTNLGQYKQVIYNGSQFYYLLFISMLLSTILFLYVVFPSYYDRYLHFHVYMNYILVHLSIIFGYLCMMKTLQNPDEI